MSRFSARMTLIVQLLGWFIIAMPIPAGGDSTAQESVGSADGVDSSTSALISRGKESRAIEPDANGPDENGIDANGVDEDDTARRANVSLAGHSEHGDAYNQGPRQNAYLMGGTGQVDLKVTTTHAQAQAYFDQGLGQLYGFWYYEAERSFRRVVALDPNCAMGYWGLAQANIDNKQRGAIFIGEAYQKKEHVGDHEQRYIEALHVYLTKEASEKELRSGYVKDLEKIIRQYPNDVEAKAMLAVHLWQSSKHGLPIVSHQAVDSLLEDIFRKAANHPAHHFRIHLWDQEAPSQALASAAVCGQAAPTIAHMWHMPGHIFSRLHRYHDAIFQQEASARADHAHMMRDGVLPDQIHNYAHNNEWLIRNLIHVGRAGDAMSLARNMLELPQHPKYNAYSKTGMCSCKYGRSRLLQIHETFEMWDELVEVSQSVYLPATDIRELQTQRLRSLGVARHRRGETEQLAKCIQQLESLAEAIGCDANKAAREAEQSLRVQWNRGKQLPPADAVDASEDRIATGLTADLTADLTTDLTADLTAGPTTGPTTDVATGNLASDATDSVKAISIDQQPEDRNADASPTQNSEQASLAAGATNGKEEQTEPPQLSPAEMDQRIKKARQEAKDRASQGIDAVERAIAELRGLQWLARGETDQALEQFAKTDCHKARLAEYYFLCGNHEKAVKLVEQAVESGDNEVYPLAKQVDLLRRMGKKKAAQAAFGKLRRVAGKADLNTPLLLRLEKFATELEYPTDWRISPETHDDVGNRPDLNTLGPLQWAPSPATPWSLPGKGGAKVSLSDFRGRPVVVIFYLGAGCLHCVEQLHEFAPLQNDFELAGISLVAISTESALQLETSLHLYSAEGHFPISLVANEDLSVFKAYRAYDDFENMPLHGTFLIDAEGFIRWCDISYEPFLSAEFLLQECQRLLSTNEHSQE